MATASEMRSALLANSYNSMLSAPIKSAAEFAFASAVDVIQRSLTYVWNQGALNTAPDARALLDAHLRGTLSSDDLRTGLGSLGITLLGAQGSRSWGPMWRSVMESAYPWPSPETAFWSLVWGQNHHTINGPDKTENFKTLLKRAGHGDPLVSTHILNYYSPLSAEQIMYFFGSATDDTIAQGNSEVAEKSWVNSKLIPAAGGLPWLRFGREDWASRCGVSSAVQAYWRRLPTWGEGAFKHYLRKSGALLNHELSAAELIAKPIPDVRYLIDFVTRNADDENIVKLHGLDSGLTEQHRMFLDWHGYGWEVPNTPRKPNGTPVTFADLIWRAHWLPIPFHQVLLAATRLSPKNVAKWRGMIGPNVQQFELADIRQALFRTGIPDGLQDTAIALGFQSLGWRAVSRIINIAGEYPEEVKATLGKYGADNENVEMHISRYEAEQLRDSGLSPNDTDIMEKVARLTVRERLTRKDRKIKEQISHQIRQTTRNAYMEGLITRNRAEQSIRNSGWTQENAVMYLDLADWNEAVNEIKILKRRIKSDYFNGEINAAQAQQALEVGGMIQAAAAATLRFWRTLLSKKRRQLSTANILQFVRDGLLDTNEASRRLSNLGWEGGDIFLLMADNAFKVQSAIRKAQTQTAAQLQRNVMQQKKAASELSAKLAKMTPPSAIKRLYQQGDWSARQVRDRLTAMGYDRIGIRTFLADAKPFKELTLSQLTALFRAGVIDEQDYRDYVADLGYRKDQADAYISMVTES